MHAEVNFRNALQSGPSRGEDPTRMVGPETETDYPRDHMHEDLTQTFARTLVVLIVNSSPSVTLSSLLSLSLSLSLSLTNLVKFHDALFWLQTGADVKQQPHPPGCT